jgi:hypothetical protein
LIIVEVNCCVSMVCTEYNSKPQNQPQLNAAAKKSEDAIKTGAPSRLAALKWAAGVLGIDPEDVAGWENEAERLKIIDGATTSTDTAKQTAAAIRKSYEEKVAKFDIGNGDTSGFGAYATRLRLARDTLIEPAEVRRDVIMFPLSIL